MLIFLAKRLLGLGFTLLLLSGGIFILLEIVPGDPAAAMLGTAATPETVAALRSALGLDQPALLRYLAWIGGLATGDLGQSFSYGAPVGQLIAERLAVTLPLTALAILLAVLIGLPLGANAAARPGGWADWLTAFYCQLGLAVPNFWIGLILILALSLGLHWLPAGGFPGWQTGLLSGLTALILPALALAIPQSAVLARVTRASVVEVMGEDFMRTALAKGCTLRQALWRHVMPNALLPIVTILGLQLSFLIAGAVLVENVFTLPGLGRLAWQALAQRDFPVIRSVVLLLALLVIGVNLLVDTASALIDPRLRRRA
jgi:peptide/nickel transport system permease protein